MNDIRLGLRRCLRHPVLSLAAIFSLGFLSADLSAVAGAKAEASAKR